MNITFIYLSRNLHAKTMYRKEKVAKRIEHKTKLKTSLLNNTIYCRVQTADCFGRAVSDLKIHNIHIY